MENVIIFLLVLIIVAMGAFTFFLLNNILNVYKKIIDLSRELSEIKDNINNLHSMNYKHHNFIRDRLSGIDYKLDKILGR